MRKRNLIYFSAFKSYSFYLVVFFLDLRLTEIIAGGKCGGNPINHSRTKHILAKYRFIRDRVAEGEIVLEWVKSEMNGANMMTKHASVGDEKTNKMLIGMV